MRTRTSAEKLGFIRRYVNHLWKCYKTIEAVRPKIDSMLTRVYTL